MNDKEVGHIRGNLSELTNKTVWNISCKTVPLETGVFDQDNIAELEAIPNEKDRTLRFYELFLKKKDSYQHLMTTLEEGCQSEALEILTKLDVNSPIAEPNSSQCFQVMDDDEMTNDDDLADDDEVTYHDEMTEETRLLLLTCGSDTTLQTVNESSIAGSNRGQISMRIQFDLMPPVELFTGRVNQLAYLHEKLQQRHTSPTMFSHMAAIVGVGGIGKTELARMYIQKYEEAYDNNVIWINAEAEETLTESFQRLAKEYLQISLLNDGDDDDRKEKSVKSLVEEVYNFFVDKQCLFVFDNAESNENFRKFMPFQVADPDQPHILLISRNRDWERSVEMAELNEMEELEAVDFVKDGLQIRDDKQDQLVVQLIQALQCFPIAISQAISYIQQQKIIKDYNINEYLEDYKSCSENLLGVGEQIGYAKSFYTTLKMTMELLSKNKDYGEIAIGILNMIAYFQPNKIPIYLLVGGDMKKLLQSISNTGILSRAAQFFLGFTKFLSASASLSFPEKSAKALELLVNYSMVSIHSTGDTISIHRLTQEVTRIELREKTLETRILRNILKLLSKNLYGNTISHFCSVFKYCGAYKELVVSFKDIPMRILPKDDDDEEKSSHFCVIIGVELKETLQKHVSSDDVALIRLEYRLARANYRARNFDLASKRLEQILPFYLEDKTDDFTWNETLNVQHLLSDCLASVGRFTESLKMKIENYKKAKEFHGLNYWRTIQILIEIAEYLRRFGYFLKPTFACQKCVQELMEVLIAPEPQEIISLLKAAYEKKKHLIGTDGNYSGTMNFIATFFMEIGDNDTATTIANDVYEQGRHSNDTTVQFYSMNCSKLLEDLKDEERINEEALRIQERGPVNLSRLEACLLDLDSRYNLFSEFRNLAQLEDLLKRDSVKY